MYRQNRALIKIIPSQSRIAFSFLYPSQEAYSSPVLCTTCLLREPYLHLTHIQSQKSVLERNTLLQIRCSWMTFWRNRKGTEMHLSLAKELSFHHTEPIYLEKKLAIIK